MSTNWIDKNMEASSSRDNPVLYWNSSVNYNGRHNTVSDASQYNTSLTSCSLKQMAQAVSIQGHHEWLDKLLSQSSCYHRDHHRDSDPFQQDNVRRRLSLQNNECLLNSSNNEIGTTNNNNNHDTMSSTNEENEEHLVIQDRNSVKLTHDSSQYWPSTMSSFRPMSQYRSFEQNISRVESCSDMSGELKHTDCITASSNAYSRLELLLEGQADSRCESNWRYSKANDVSIEAKHHNEYEMISQANNPQITSGKSTSDWYHRLDKTKLPDKTELENCSDYNQTQTNFDHNEQCFNRMITSSDRPTSRETPLREVQKSSPSSSPIFHGYTSHSWSNTEPNNGNSLVNNSLVTSDSTDHLVEQQFTNSHNDQSYSESATDFVDRFPYSHQSGNNQIVSNQVGLKSSAITDSDHAMANMDNPHTPYYPFDHNNNLSSESQNHHYYYYYYHHHQHMHHHYQRSHQIQLPSSFAEYSSSLTYPPRFDDGSSMSDHHHHQQPATTPRELEAFSELFKQRRIKLGVTQADVGKALGSLKIAGVGSLSQSTICRFESLTLSHNNMVALKPVLQAWLEEAEADHRRYPELFDCEFDPLTGAGDLASRRKRTSITDGEKRALEAFFSVQPRPSSDKISQIADKLKLRKNVVRVWFCNQRQKQKRMKFSTLGMLT